MKNARAHHGSRSTVRKLLLVVVAIVIVVAAIYSGFYFAIVRPTMQLTRDVAAEFRSAFNFTPQIRVSDTTVIEQNTPVLELATAQRDVFQRYEWENTYLGSTKRIVLEGTFAAKAGYDLTRPFVVAVRANRFTVTLPEPELLSFGLKDYRIVQDEDGWWNKITSEERTKVFKELQASAQQKAVAAGIVNDARRNFEERLRQFGKSRGAMAEITHRTTPD